MTRLRRSFDCKKKYTKSVSKISHGKAQKGAMFGIIACKGVYKKSLLLLKHVRSYYR